MNPSVYRARDQPWLFCYENAPLKGRSKAPTFRQAGCTISSAVRRSQAWHQVPSPVLSVVLGILVFSCPG